MRNGSIVEERECAGRTRVTLVNFALPEVVAGLSAGVYLRTSLEGAAQSHFVGIFEITAYG